MFFILNNGQSSVLGASTFVSNISKFLLTLTLLGQSCVLNLGVLGAAPSLS